MADTDLITQLILSRGLFDPKYDPDETILASNELLALVAGAWRGSQQAITEVVKARIYKIEKDMVGNATAAEVIILRQAMLEVAFIVDDFIAYEQTFARREKEAADSGAPAQDAPANETAPAVETPQADTAPTGTETPSTASSM